ncbi:MAG: CDP-glycerol glycerophosphotransferase family protein [Parabacteroides sp.]|nr:CDP-glycerol glycerophosphotransferase family protein [Parabacteroides sp.]
MRKYLRLIVCFFIDILLCLLHKRDKQIVVCSGWCGERFADNSRYMFLYLCQNQDSLQLKRVVWLTNDIKIKEELRASGFTVYMKRSFRSVFYHLRAGYFFYDQFSADYYVFLTRQAKLINLWHGMPIKKFGLWDDINWDLKDDYLLTCSAFGDKTIGGAFTVKPEHLVHGMYPRDYYLLHDNLYPTIVEQSYLNIVEEQKKAGKKILFYLPTFRKSKLMFLGESDSDQILSFFKFLERHNYFMLMKIHSAGYFNNHDSIDFSANRLLNLPPAIDIYPFLKKADILITDYSSVLFDFLYLDRDIICYPYDLQDYQNKDRGLLIDYEDLPADKVYSIQELTANLLEKKEHRDRYAGARKCWLHKCFENYTMEDTIKNIFLS